MNPQDQDLWEICPKFQKGQVNRGLLFHQEDQSTEQRNGKDLLKLQVLNP